MISKTITLKCRYCGREFQQEVKAETEEKLKKEIKWYERNQLHLQMQPTRLHFLLNK